MGNCTSYGRNPNIVKGTSVCYVNGVLTSRTECYAPNGRGKSTVIVGYGKNTFSSGKESDNANG